jgi:ribosome-binding protein aMBF1 (putative translation factor)
MIKNERQYRITRRQIERFEEALVQLSEHEAERSQLDPILRKAEEDGINSILAELREEVQEYEALRSRQRAVLEYESFNDLPRALIQARIASGLSQRELAERLGIKEQQVQNYEATEYASASFTRLREVVEALNVSVHERFYLPATR